MAKVKKETKASVHIDKKRFFLPVAFFCLLKCYITKEVHSMAGIFFVDDRTETTDFSKITAAINAARSAGGGIVCLGNRTYNVSQSIVLHKNIVFQGLGNSSAIRCSEDCPIIRIYRIYNAAVDSSDITIRDMVLVYDPMTSTERFHIEADRPLNLRIIRVKISGPNRNFSGILTWDATTNNRETPIQGGSNASMFMTHIEDCRLECASIWLNDSDSRIINNYIWANGSNPNRLSYAVRLSNGSVNVSGNDIVPGNDAGIYLASTCSLVRIENNYFDGSWDDVWTGVGVKAVSSTCCLILGNTFCLESLGGVLLENTIQFTIVNNVFKELNRTFVAESPCDIKIKSVAFFSSGHIIATNQHFRSIEGFTTAAVIVDNGSQASILDNCVMDWSSSGSAYFLNPYQMQTYEQALKRDNRVRINSLVQYASEEGAVVAEETTTMGDAEVCFSARFTSMGIVPRMQDLIVNFSGTNENSSVCFCIKNLNSSGFHISYKRNGSASSSAGVFYWRVILR